jgi:ABC-type Na+ efflux pump permease subunit
LDITPIFNRELFAATRRTGLWGNRGFFAGILLVIVLATFGARYYWDHGRVTDHDMMARVAFQAFLWMLVAHMLPVFSVFAQHAALSIALEKDRRTLDFLLATRLSNAEIVLGKLAACIATFTADVAVGLPIVLLMNPLGSIDLKLMLLAYAGLGTTAFFVIALVIWVSTGAPDSRRAASASVLAMMAWLCLPFFVSMVFTKASLRLPGFLLTVNAWVLASSPLSVMFKIGGGVTASSGLVDAVAWMSGLQLAGGTALVIWAAARLRSAYRRNVSGDSRSVLARLTRPGWRWRPKPPVGDDPILWREMNVARAGFLGKLAGLLITLAMYSVLSYVTFFYARHAVIELWRHGYRAGITTAEPEWNIFIRFFMPGYGITEPTDVARTDLNLFLRNITIPTVFLIMLLTIGMATEGIISERVRETWGSLIATPLTARDILRSKLLAVLWRLRLLLATLLVLWTIGLAAGAIHPLGFIVSVLVLAALTWFMLTFGLRISLAAKDMAAVTGPTTGLVFLACGLGVLPLVLPGRWNSILLGAGSPPFALWMSLVSYRDIHIAWHQPSFPLLKWLHIASNEGPLSVVATWLIGIIAPTLGGLYLWRYSVAHFDRLIGRPCKDTPAEEQTRRLAIAPAAAS